MKVHTMFDSRGLAATILIRLMVGAVFLSEGLQKFLLPETIGAGRFAKIGFAAPHLVAPFVGSFEIACGALVLLGLATRLAAAPLILVMLTALVTTKLPILLGSDLGPFRLPNVAQTGFWAMAHEARTDWSMLLGALFLLIVGGGRWSIDALLTRGLPRGGAP